MTGGRVNDAPALKQVNIGIAMGVTGTEVARDAVAIVLTDDNFSAIVRAISNGRGTYGNVKNSIKFLLPGDTVGILSVLYTSLCALPNSSAPVHLLFVNLVTGSFPAIVIGLEPYDETITKETPRDRNTPMLDKSPAVEVVPEGLLIAIGTTFAYYADLSAGDAGTARTIAFAILCLPRLLYESSSRGKEPLFRPGILINKFIWIVMVIGSLMLLAVLTFQPLVVLFEIAPLTGNQCGVIFGLPLMPLILIQIYKTFLIRRK